jgi:hypothetical protein
LREQDVFRHLSTGFESIFIDVLYPTVKNTLTGRIAFPALDALREGYDVYPVVDAIAGTSVEAHRAGLERRAVLVGLSALVLASDVIGGIVYDATGPGGALTLLGRAGAAISSPPAGFGDLAREGGREAPAPSQGAIGGAGEGAPRTR